MPRDVGHTHSKVPAGDLLLNVKVAHASMLMLVLPVFVNTVYYSGLARRYAKEENRRNVCNVQSKCEILLGISIPTRW